MRDWLHWPIRTCTVKGGVATYHSYPGPEPGTAFLTNCSNNYGPYQFPEKLIPLMVLNALHGERLPVYGNGSNVRDWLFVDDHARALGIVLEKELLGL